MLQFCWRVCKDLKIHRLWSYQPSKHLLLYPSICVPRQEDWAVAPPSWALLSRVQAVELAARFFVGHRSRGRWTPLRWNSTEIRMHIRQIQQLHCISLPAGLATGGVSSDIPVISVWCAVTIWEDLRSAEGSILRISERPQPSSAFPIFPLSYWHFSCFKVIPAISESLPQLAHNAYLCIFRAWHRRFLAADVSVIQRFLDLDEKLMQSFLYRSQNPRGKRVSPSCDRPLLCCSLLQTPRTAFDVQHPQPHVSEGMAHLGLFRPVKVPAIVSWCFMSGFQRLLCHLRRFQSLTVSNRFWIWIIWLCLKIGYPQIPRWIISFSPLATSIDILTHFGCFRTHPCVKKLRHSASSPPISCYLGVPRSEHASDTSDWGRGSSWAKLSRHSELPTLSNMGRVAFNWNYHDLSSLITFCHIWLYIDTRDSIYNYISHVYTGHCISLFWRHPMNKHWRS